MLLMCNGGLPRVEGRKEIFNYQKGKEAMRRGENASFFLLAAGHGTSHSGQDQG